ncbi:ABC transporter ATP-binding protein [Streptomyces sp. 110]|uniref:ABC transporter ATP-binding protein n=1 Tax=Streptomyces endocoffeicus TaxID=2898945 RepID=A0ABS1Q5C0_9ACTN|nr:ABC transporter ATP-binding protein [Streptomyces endocoffeicus]MBL1119848.1 ABC transporter ATP-binding protein [Streptomyces endocoffeicus]
MTKTFGPTDQALRQVTVSCQAGETLTLVGPSGCGKTTLLRCIAGLDHPTGGTIRINGRDMTHADPQRRSTAMVFQNYALYPAKTVAANIEFPLVMGKVPRSERAGRVAGIARLLRLTSHLEKKPAQLSGGQKQRVGIGRALIRQPSVLLMDEPLSNLDAALRVDMRTELHELFQKLGATVVYVTHDQTEALTLGDQVAVLNEGQLQQQATPREVYARPANRFTASFLGAMNLLDGTVQDGYFRTPDGSPIVELRAPKAAATACIGIRPEDLRTADTSAGRPHITLTGRVRLLELLGSEELAHITLASDHKLKARLPVGTVIADTVRLCVDVERLHLFDAEGIRIDT